MKNTVFAFLSLSTAVSTMGYAADVSLTQEDAAAQIITDVSSQSAPQVAADLGRLNAMNNYAEMLYHRKEVKQDYTKAQRYYQQAAKRVFENTMHNYAEMLHRGEVGELSLVQAGGSPGALSTLKIDLFNGQDFSFQNAILLKKEERPGCLSRLWRWLCCAK